MIAVVALDVDGVLAPSVVSQSDRTRVEASGYAHHRYAGPGPDGAPVAGDVWLHPEHGTWLLELQANGAELAWATSWGQQANAWVADKIGLPADLPVIEVGVGRVAWGRSHKRGPIARWAGDRPLVWLDDEIGGKDWYWAEERTAVGTSTLLVQVNPATGLTRAAVDYVGEWLIQQHTTDLP